MKIPLVVRQSHDAISDPGSMQINPMKPLPDPGCLVKIPMSVSMWPGRGAAICADNDRYCAIMRFVRAVRSCPKHQFPVLPKQGIAPSRPISFAKYERFSKSPRRSRPVSAEQGKTEQRRVRRRLHPPPRTPPNREISWSANNDADVAAFRAGALSLETSAGIATAVGGAVFSGRQIPFPGNRDGGCGDRFDRCRYCAASPSIWR